MTERLYKKFTLVIPTLNEAGNIETVLDRASATLSRMDCDWSVVVVDDCSSDGTSDVVTRYSQENSRVQLVTRRGERGLSGAITFGWKHTDAAWLGVMDADLQHPPEVLAPLLGEMAKGADIVIASRYLRPDSMDGWNPVRKLISQVGVLISRLVQRREIRAKDPLSGFFIVRRECIEGIEFQKSGFKLLLEILALGRISTLKEVPSNFAVRKSGNSKANTLVGVQYVTLLSRLLFKRDRAVLK